MKNTRTFDSQEAFEKELDDYFMLDGDFSKEKDETTPGQYNYYGNIQPSESVSISEYLGYFDTNTNQGFMLEPTMAAKGKILKKSKIGGYSSKAKFPQGFEFWNYITENFGKYYSSNEVALSDDLSKYIDGESDDELDESLEEHYGVTNDKTARELLVETDRDLFTRAVVDKITELGGSYEVDFGDNDDEITIKDTRTDKFLTTKDIPSIDDPRVKEEVEMFVNVIGDKNYWKNYGKSSAFRISEIVDDIVKNWHNYRKEFTENEDAKAKDYMDAINEYARKKSADEAADGKWFKKAVEEKAPYDLGGWSKSKPATVRRRNAIKSRDQKLSKHKQYISAARALQSLANVTKDPDTKDVAKRDADYFFEEAKKFEDGGKAAKGKKIDSVVFVLNEHDEGGDEEFVEDLGSVKHSSDSNSFISDLHRAIAEARGVSTYDINFTDNPLAEQNMQSILAGEEFTTVDRDDDVRIWYLTKSGKKGKMKGKMPIIEDYDEYIENIPNPFGLVGADLEELVESGYIELGKKGEKGYEELYAKNNKYEHHEGGNVNIYKSFKDLITQKNKIKTEKASDGSPVNELNVVDYNETKKNSGVWILETSDGVKEEYYYSDETSEEESGELVGYFDFYNKDNTRKAVAKASLISGNFDNPEWSDLEFDKVEIISLLYEIVDPDGNKWHDNRGYSTFNESQLIELANDYDDEITTLEQAKIWINENIAEPVGAKIQEVGKAAKGKSIDDKNYIVTKTISGEGYSDPEFKIFATHAEAFSYVKSEIVDYEGSLGYVVNETSKDQFTLQKPDDEDGDSVRIQIIEVPANTVTLLKWEESEDVKVIGSYPKHSPALKKMKDEANKIDWEDEDEVSDYTTKFHTGGHGPDGFIWFQILELGMNDNDDDDDDDKAADGYMITSESQPGELFIGHSKGGHQTQWVEQWRKPKIFKTKAEANEFLEKYPVFKGIVMPNISKANREKYANMVYLMGATEDSWKKNNPEAWAKKVEEFKELHKKLYGDSDVVARLKDQVAADGYALEQTIIDLGQMVDEEIYHSYMKLSKQKRSELDETVIKVRRVMRASEDEEAVKRSKAYKELTEKLGLKKAADGKATESKEFYDFKNDLEAALHKRYSVMLSDTDIDNDFIKNAMNKGESIESIVTYVGQKNGLTPVSATIEAVEIKVPGEPKKKAENGYICIVKDRSNKVLGQYPISYNDEAYADNFLSAIGVKLKPGDKREIVDSE